MSQIGTMFSNAFRPPAAPAAPAAPQATARMPDTTSPAVLEAQRLARQRSMERAGRRSTILGGGSDQFDSYSARSLGAGSS